MNFLWTALFVLFLRFLVSAQVNSYVVNNVHENARNLLDSINANNSKNRQRYSEIIKQKMVQEQYVFDGLKNNLKDTKRAHFHRLYHEERKQVTVAKRNVPSATPSATPLTIPFSTCTDVNDFTKEVTDYIATMIPVKAQAAVYNIQGQWFGWDKEINKVFEEAENGATGKQSVLKRMRNLVHTIDNLLSNENVHAAFESIGNLNASDIPPTVDANNETTVELFQRLYRTYFAILRTNIDDDVSTKFKRSLRSLTTHKSLSKIAILMAQVSCILSQVKDDNKKVDVDWDDEIEMIGVFTRWGMVDEKLLNVTRAFYRLKPPRVTNKKIRIHAPDIEEEALTQFNDCYSKDFVLEAALMPDAHSGYVAPIGSVIKTKGAVVPAWVGYDIGCGMIAVQIADNKTAQNIIRGKAEQIFDGVKEVVPMGVGEYNKLGGEVYLTEKLENALEKLKASTSYERLYGDVEQKSKPNLGTLGSGNHFIEISTNNDETWLVIHSGSRKVGHHVGTSFMKMVSGLTKGYDNTFAITDPKMRDEYMHFQDYCLEFALLNRMSMAKKVEKVIKRITGIEYDTDKNLWTNKHHNHCIKVGNNTFLHRKGATSSGKGERGVIPGNMRDGCYLVEGLGNEEFLHSSSHGAGRQMSRGKANAKIDFDSFKETMEGIVAPVNQKTIDESPFAYKNISQVMQFQRESVKILKHLKPIINWKGY